MPTCPESLYLDALAADSHFHAAVVKQFGESRACDMRYQTKQFNLETLAAAKAKWEADQRWLSVLRSKTA